MRLTSLIIILLCCATSVFGQTVSQADSLLRIIQKMPDDTTKLKALAELGFSIRNSDPQYSKQLLEQALKLFKKVDLDRERPRILSFAGVACEKSGEHRRAMELFRQAENWSKKLNNPQELGYAFHNISTVHKWQNSYDSASIYAYKALRIFEEIKHLQGVAYAYSTLSQISQGLGNYELAIRHAENTLKIRQLLNDKRGVEGVYNIIGQLQLEKGDYNKALKYFLKNVKANAGFGESEGLAVAYLNIAQIYILMELYATSISFANKALKYYEKAGNQGMVAEARLKIGKANFFMRDYEKAEQNTRQSLQLAQQSGRRTATLSAYLQLSEVYEAEGKLREALNAHKNYVALKDSIFSEASIQGIGREQGRFEIFQKDQENKMLKQQERISESIIQQQKIRGWFMLAGLLFFIVIISILILTNRTRRRDNALLKVQNQKIEEQRKAIAVKTLALSKAQEELTLHNKYLEEKVAERTHELKKSNEELELYANLASHDLKQPLRNIAGFSQLLNRHLKKQKIEDERVQEYTKFIIDNTEYMHTLIEDLLAFSKFSVNQDRQMKPTTINYQDILYQASQNLRRQSEETNAEIVMINIPTEGFGYKIKLTQLFQNLLSNAMKFRHKGKPVRIKIEGLETETHFQFSVTDNGIGIEQKYFDVIFETFKKLHSKQEYSGMGLGLSMCKKVVEQHHGDIWLSSEVGNGTTFFFTLKKEF